MDYIGLLNDLRKRTFEADWFKFKVNWFNVDELGQYISALSNTAKVIGSEFAYFFWGVENDSHDIIGTSFDYNREINHEPLEHYLLRNLNPKINIKFDEFDIEGKRIIILIIPSANNIPTSYKQVRYIRVGSSVESLLRYPEREANLWADLNHKMTHLKRLSHNTKIYLSIH